MIEELAAVVESVEKVGEAAVEKTAEAAEHITMAVEQVKAVEQTCVAEGLVKHADFTGFDVKVAETFRDSLREARERFPGLDIPYVGSLSGQRLNLETAFTSSYEQELYRQFGNAYTAEEYRMVAGEYAKEVLNTLGFDETDGVYAWSSRFSESFGPGIRQFDGIAVNDVFAGDFEKFTESKRRDEMTGWSPEGCNSAKSVLDHELGHEIDKLIGASQDPVLCRMYEDMMKNGGGREVLSAYGEKSVAEFIAEGYSEFVNSPDPRPMSKAIMQRLEELYQHHAEGGYYGTK